MASKKGRKSEKQNKTPEVVQAEERPAEREIVPGKEFYENDWTQLLQREEDLSFISSLVEEVFEHSCVIVVHQANEEEAYSFSVQWAKQLMMDKINCFFIEYDHGEEMQKSAKSNSIQDLEPDVPIIDSWARGIVPMTEDQELKGKGSQEGKKKEKEEPLIEKIDQEHSQSNNGDEINNVNPSSLVKPIKKSRHSCETRNNVNKSMKVISSPPEESCSNESPSVISHTPFSSTAFLSVPLLMTGPDSELKLPNKRSQIKTDQHNRVIETIRLDTRKFPSPSTKPIVILEKCSPSQSHISNTTSKKCIGLKSSVRKVFPPKQAPTIKLFNDKFTTDTLGGMNRIESHRVPKEPTLPPFLDIIDPLPGVTVYENGQTLTGHASPRNKVLSPHSRLQPITPNGRKTHKISESRRSIKQSDPFKLIIPCPLDNTVKTYPTLNVS